jgi:hypothetical protein
MKLLISALALTMAMATPSLATDLTKKKKKTVTVDVTKINNGYRATKIVGSNVVNDANEKIGTVDDLLVDAPATSLRNCIRSAASSAWVRNSSPCHSIHSRLARIASFSRWDQGQLKSLPIFNTQRVSRHQRGCPEVWYTPQSTIRCRRSRWARALQRDTDGHHDADRQAANSGRCPSARLRARPPVRVKRR